MRATSGGGNGGKDLAAEAGTAADIEDQRGGCEVEEGEGAVGHGGLDGEDTRGGSVFAGFDVGVEEVGWAGGRTVISTEREGGRGKAHRVSSGRDIVGFLLVICRGI